MTVPIPGFQKFLERTFKEPGVVVTSLDDGNKKVRRFVGLNGVTRGDLTVVDVKHSSNIRRLEYDAKDKTLTTTFVSGGVDIKKGIAVEIFAQVANPGPEFEHSVGKAFYQLVVKPSKVRA